MIASAWPGSSGATPTPANASRAPRENLDGQPFLNDPEGHNKPFDSLTAYGFSATILGKIGNANFKSITAYRYSDAAGLNELDASPLQTLATQ